MSSGKWRPSYLGLNTLILKLEPSRICTAPQQPPKGMAAVANDEHRKRYLYLENDLFLSTPTLINLIWLPHRNQNQEILSILQNIEYICDFNSTQFLYE